MSHPTPRVRAPARSRRAGTLVTLLVALATSLLVLACGGGSTAAPGGATSAPGETMGETTAPTSGY
jgi:hypothetical protein